MGGGRSHIKMTVVLVVPFRVHNLEIGTKSKMTTIRIIVVPLRHWSNDNDYKNLEEEKIFNGEKKMVKVSVLVLF